MTDIIYSSHFYFNVVIVNDIYFIIKLKFIYTSFLSLYDDRWTPDEVLTVDSWLTRLPAIKKRRIKTSISNVDKKKEKRRKTKSYLLALGNIEEDVSFLPPCFLRYSFFLSIFLSCAHKKYHEHCSLAKVFYWFITIYFFFIFLFVRFNSHLFVTDWRIDTTTRYNLTQV